MANFPTIAIGLPFVHDLGLNADAVTHFNRVIADGGVVPQGLTGVNFVFNQLQLAIGSGYLAVSATCYDPEYLGYKLGTGSGITLGQATQKLYAIGGSGFDVVQNTVASQPLLLAWNSTDTNYYFNPCISSNSVTSGTALGYTSSTDTLIITAKIFANNQTTISWDNIVIQNTLFGLQIQNNGTAKKIRINATTAATASSSYTPSSTNPHFVRVTITTANITYAWSADGITYTTLDSGITLPTFGTTGTLTIGGSANSTANVCKIYSVILNNSTTSSTITFDPNSYSASSSQTSWTGGGATWTINTGTATTGYKGVLVNRTMSQNNGEFLIGQLLSPSFTAISNRTLFLSFNAFSSGFSYLVDDNTTIVRNSIVKLSGETARIYLNTTATATDVATGSINTLKLITAFVGASTQSIQFNNGTAVTSGTITPSTTVGVSMFTRADGGNSTNAIITSFFMLNMTTDATIRTAIYNLLKTMNNNAF
jgi:hypothetical protein